MRVGRSCPRSRPVNTASKLRIRFASSSGTTWEIASRKARGSRCAEATARVVGGILPSTGFHGRSAAGPRDAIITRNVLSGGRPPPPVDDGLDQGLGIRKGEEAIRVGHVPLGRSPRAPRELADMIGRTGSIAVADPGELAALL